jgi:hypothetical protein
VTAAFVRHVTVLLAWDLFDKDPGLAALQVDFRDGEGVTVHRPAAAPATPWVEAPGKPRVVVPVKEYLMSADGTLPESVSYRVRGLGAGRADKFSAFVTEDTVEDELYLTAYPPSS